MREIFSNLSYLFQKIKPSLPEDKAKWIAEYIDANELGVAFELILEYKIEFNLKLDEHYCGIIRYCGNQMKIDVERYI